MENPLLSVPTTAGHEIKRRSNHLQRALNAIRRVYTATGQLLVGIKRETSETQ